jgi:hypothetical protein
MGSYLKPVEIIKRNQSAAYIGFGLSRRHVMGLDSTHVMALESTVCIGTVTRMTLVHAGALLQAARPADCDPAPASLPCLSGASLAAPQADGGPGALRWVFPAAESDSGSIITLVVCVAVVPGRTKLVGNEFRIGRFPPFHLWGLPLRRHCYKVSVTVNVLPPA